MQDRPALLGGKPAFPEPIDIVRPTLPGLGTVAERFREVLLNGKITNNGRYVRAFEEELSARLSAPTIVVANGTLALMLLLRALGRRGEVVVPSFTFAATAHAATWCGLGVRFADIDPETWTLDPVSVREACGPDTVAILGVHVFGVPCDVDSLESVAREVGVPLLFDAAHGFGASYRGRSVGTLGDAEVFSFHATKGFAVGEGGAICTRQATWGEAIRLGRNFGLDGDGGCCEAGLNAKMSELFAILGLEALDVFPERMARRQRVGQALRERLGKLPGITLQRIPEDREANHQNFAILVDPERFGLSRDALQEAMAAENATTRKYFYPPLHRMSCYRDAARGARLPETERVADQVLCLPIYSNMSDQEVNALVFAVERIHAGSEGVQAHLEQKAGLGPRGRREP